MRKCIFCKRPYKKGSKISFHRFPTDLQESILWVQNMKPNNINWTPKTHDCLCSEHFDIKCFDKHYNKTTLKVGSIPTIFDGLFEEPNTDEVLKISDSENVSRGKDIDMEDSQPAVSTYPYKYAMSPAPISESVGTSSSSRHQSPKKRVVKRLLSDIRVEDNGFQNNASTTDELEMELKDSIKTSHNYGVSTTPKQARIEYGVAHDHQYENSPSSSEKSLQRSKQALKLSKARIKALTQHVKRLEMKLANLKTVRASTVQCRVLQK